MKNYSFVWSWGVLLILIDQVKNYSFDYDLNFGNLLLAVPLNVLPNNKEYRYYGMVLCSMVWYFIDHWILLLCGRVTYVAEWLFSLTVWPNDWCGPVTVWPSGCVAERLCGQVTVWPSDCVAEWLCGRTSVWPSDYVAGWYVAEWHVAECHVAECLWAAHSLCHFWREITSFLRHFLETLTETGSIHWVGVQYTDSRRGQKLNLKNSPP